MKKCLLILVWGLTFLSVIPVCVESKQIIGWLEMILIYPGDLRIRAKMDTGAKSSSINAVNLKKFERGHETWVNFELKTNTKKGKSKKIILEKKVLRSVKIKRRGGGLEERLVVRIEICLGRVHKEIEVSLNDRSNFNYQVLIGRTDLENDFVIDPSVTFSSKPLCKNRYN